MIIDRSTVGLVGHEIDDWVTYNLLLLAVEIVFRYVISHFVTLHNFDWIQRYDWFFQILTHGFTIYGIMIIYGISDEELRDKLEPYYDSSLIHTIINVMLLARIFTLICSAILYVCIAIFVCVWFISGTIPKMKQVDKVLGIKKFINSKSRKYKKG